MTSREDFLPYEAVPPGETLRETIEALGLSQADLVRRMERPAKTINEIINGKAAITPDTAIQLERVLGVPASFWNNLERNYQLTLARIRAERDLEQQTAILGRFPYAEMARHKWVPPAVSKVDKVRALLRFFGVNSLDTVRQIEPAAFRRSPHHHASPEALAAWLRRGVIQAAAIGTEPFDDGRFRSALAAIRKLTVEREFQFKTAVKICASSGVAVVAVPHLQRTYVNGATRWIGPGRALLQLSIRYKYEDIFWFTFFHEAGHILLHGKKEVILESTGGDRTPEEKEADAFATDTLIPPGPFAKFASRADWSITAIRRFAEEVEVAPSIVVGRLHHESLLPHSHLNTLRRQLHWVTTPDQETAVP